MNDTLAKALPWAARLIALELGVEFRPGDSAARLIDACEQRLAVSERTPELTQCLQRLASTVAHLRSCIACSPGMDLGGQSRKYEAFYRLADRINSSRIKRKIQERLQPSEKLRVISEEEAELLREALKS